MFFVVVCSCFAEVERQLSVVAGQVERTAVVGCGAVAADGFAVSGGGVTRGVGPTGWRGFGMGGVAVVVAAGLWPKWGGGGGEEGVWGWESWGRGGAGDASEGVVTVGVWDGA